MGAIDLIKPDFLVVAPHGIVLLLAILTLAYDSFAPHGARHDTVLTVISLLGYTVAIGVTLALNASYLTSFAGMAKLDDFAVFVLVVLLLAALLTVFLSATTIPRWRMPLGEYYALLAFSTLGGMLVASAADLVMVFVGIELSSLSIFILAAFAKRSRESIEGALKYFLLSAFATAILIYGMAWLYGTTGATNLAEINLRLAAYSDLNQPSLLLATLLLVIGLGFKAAAVPFHMWTPDAYQGAPTPVTAFMSVGPKVVAFAAIIRILVESLAPLRAQWSPLVVALAILTMTLGNVVAISQRDVKRMLAYSSIAHTGYMLVGIAAYRQTARGDEAIPSVLFYLFAYGFMNIGAFGIIAWLQAHGLGASLDDFRGLATSAPLQAAAMAIFLFSLTGVPPLIGFYAKYYIILAAVQADLTWLAVVVVVLSAVSAYFYLRVVATMYFGEPVDRPAALPARFMGAGILAMVVATFAFGIFSGPVIELARQWYLSL